jgi:hypothetical protein
MNIREFTADVLKMRGEKKSNDPIPWNDLLQKQGYYSVPSKGFMSLRNPPTEWCKEQFGDDHFVWTGSDFWFETEAAAVLFALRWS